MKDLCNLPARERLQESRRLAAKVAGDVI